MILFHRELKCSRSKLRGYLFVGGSVCPIGFDLEYRTRTEEFPACFEGNGVPIDDVSAVAG